jgi:hypothetical protein
MDWLVELSEKSPESLIAVTILLVVVVVGIFGMIGLAIIKGRNRADPTQGLLEILKTLVDELKEMRIAYQNHETEESVRDVKAQNRHEATGTDVRQLTVQIGSLETVMTKHTDATPTIEDVLAEIKLLRDELKEAVETFTIKVSTVEDRIAPIETRIEQIKKTTQETPTVAKETPKEEKD